MGLEGVAVRSFPHEARQTDRDSVVIFLLGLLVFTVGLTPEFIGFQARFALFAREMLRNGPSLFPTVYGRPYPDYPAGSVFWIYLASLPFGRVTPLSTVLPSAMVSALILVLTYRIGALRSRRWGLAAAMFAILTVEFLCDSRSTALDQYTSLATALSFYIIYSAAQLGRPKRLWLLPPVGIFGFAFRGPMGLVIPVAVVCSYYLWNARLKHLVLAGVGGMIALILCMKGLLIAAAMQGGQPLAESVLSSQMTGRIDDGGQGFSYYWLRCFTSYAVSFPIAAVVIASRFKSIVRKATDDDKLLGSLAAWTLIVLVGMSIPSAKHTRYLLPIVPAISLIASYWLLSRKVGPGSSDPAIRILGLCAAVFAIVVIGIADPINYRLERTEPFVRQVEALQASRPGDLVFFKMGPDQEDIKFVVNMTHPTEPRFAASFDDLEQLSGRCYILAEEAVFESLPPDETRLSRPLLRGRIGHERVVVFALEAPVD